MNTYTDDTFIIMQAVDDFILRPLESGFAALSLNTPDRRFVATGAVVGGALMAAKPDVMFSKDGKAKPFGTGDGQTLMPWWLAAVASGLVAGVFV